MNLILCIAAYGVPQGAQDERAAEGFLRGAGILQGTAGTAALYCMKCTALLSRLFPPIGFHSSPGPLYTLCLCAVTFCHAVPPMLC